MKLARRVGWPGGRTALATAIESARSDGRRLLDLVQSNPTAVGLELPTDVIAGALARAAAAAYRAEPLGLPEAREAVARHLGLDDWRRIVITASTSEAYSHAFRLLVDPGETVLLPSPSYPLLGWLVDLADGRALEYRLDPELGFAIDRGAFAATLEASPGPRVVVGVSPNNPTGSWLDEEDTVLLAHTAYGSGAALILDEVFRPYPLSERAPPLVGQAPSALGDVLSLRFGGLSKSLAQPGLKLAWTVIGGPGPLVDEALERLEVIADTYLSASMPVQVALADLLALVPQVRGAVLERVRSNLAMLSLLEGSPASPVPVSAGWSVPLRVPADRSDEAWALELLAQDDVVVHPGSLFGFPEAGWLVISLLTLPAALEPGLRRLANRISSSG